jgi:Ca2+/Na+ antiporter
MNTQPIYSEKLSSKRTELLFIALTLLFFLLFIGRVTTGSADFLAGIFFFFFVVFLFYSLNFTGHWQNHENSRE